MSYYFIVQLIPAFFFVLIGTYILVPYNIKISNRFGFIAKINDRSIHRTEMPESGGLSFALLVITMQFTIGVFNYLMSYRYLGNLLIKFAFIGIVAVVLGLIDDKYESRARFKFISQMILAVIMWLIGYRVLYITNPFGNDFILNWLSLPISVLWFVVVMNAVNLVDGIDGLASGMTIIVSLVLCIVGVIENNILVVILSSLLIAGNLGFIRYNFYPAKIFMGDTGAMFIGLNIAAISTASNDQYKGITTMTLLVPIAVMAVPLLDTALAVFRRLHKGNIFLADKQHIHHIMLKRGYSQRFIAIAVYFTTCLFGLIAIGFSFSSKRILFSVLFGLLLSVVITAYIVMRREFK